MQGQLRCRIYKLLLSRPEPRSTICGWTPDQCGSSFSNGRSSFSGAILWGFFSTGPNNSIPSCLADDFSGLRRRAFFLWAGREEVMMGIGRRDQDRIADPDMPRIVNGIGLGDAGPVLAGAGVPPGDGEKGLPRR